MTAYGDILWTPSEQRLNGSYMARFAAFVAQRHTLALTSYEELQRWSVREPGAFWQAVADFTSVVFSAKPSTAYLPPPAGAMRGATWFADATLNYAENLLAGPDRAAAVVVLAEDAPRRSLSLHALRREVERCASALVAAGVGPGDRVAGVVGNGAEALIAMLATASLGAVWSSCSPDFGAPAVTDRLQQTTPKVLFYTAQYTYGGKVFHCLPALAQVLAALPSIRAAVVVAPVAAAASQLAADPRCQHWDDFLAAAPPRPLQFAPRLFSDPLFIMFSSGTTGVPKAIVHSVGGTLLQHKKELLLHSDIGRGSRLLFYTTCGWMMWNWSVSALATGASLVLYDGSVAAPDMGVLWRTLRDLRVTAFGTSPKYIATCMSQGTSPRAILGEHAPRTVLTTGAPLLPEHFAWLYEQVQPTDGLHLASISGGTDIISCFMLGTPTLPVRAGEIQAAGLGMDIAAWDSDGQAVVGRKGELVCLTPFPSMPVGFWNDPQGERYRGAYFDHYQSIGREVWRHGDFIEITATGGIIVYGRSDATLNPGGVRIGTAELYRQVEQEPQVVDSLAIGLHHGGDEQIVLFVKLRAGCQLDDALRQRLKASIKRGLTPRHVPGDIVKVNDIPYTRSGKKVEIAVTQAVHGEPVSNMAALANPSAMDDFIAWARQRQP